VEDGEQALVELGAHLEAILRACDVADDDFKAPEGRSSTVGSADRVLRLPYS
jgi:hypothetical protein